MLRGPLILAVAAALLWSCSAPARDDLSARDEAALRAAGIPRRAVRCNGRQVWDGHLRAEAREAVDEIVGELRSLQVEIPAERRAELRRRLRKRIMWRLVRNLLVAGRFNNLGVLALPSLHATDGRPVLLFRSGFTPDPGRPGSCMSSLVHIGGVRHVVNLYAGPMPTAALEAAEKAAIRRVGGTYYLARDAPAAAADWREHLRAGEDPERARQAAQRTVAEIINRHLLRPGGGLPRGNLHVHCGGGMHRTGMVVGVMDRCLNKTPIAGVEADYKRHVGWRSAREPGGYEQANIDFIAGFDCSLLHP